MYSLDPSDDIKEDKDGMVHSIDLINELIDREVEESGIIRSRIILGGFSQGGTVALLACLTGKASVAGCITLSGRLALQTELKKVFYPHLE